MIGNWIIAIVGYGFSIGLALLGAAMIALAGHEARTPVNGAHIRSSLGSAAIYLTCSYFVAVLTRGLLAP